MSGLLSFVQANAFVWLVTAMLCLWLAPIQALRRASIGLYFAAGFAFILLSVGLISVWTTTPFPSL